MAQVEDVDLIEEGMARPERFELPTTAFEARYSIQLSYGRAQIAHFTRIARVLTAGHDRVTPLFSEEPRRSQRLDRPRHLDRFEPPVDFFEA